MAPTLADWVLRLHDQPLDVLNEFLWKLFLDASDGYFLCNLDGFLVDTNPAFKQILGYSEADQLVDFVFADLNCFDKSLSHFLAENFEYATQGSTAHIEKIFFRNRVLALNLYPIAFESHPAILGVLKDITQRQQNELEWQLEQERYRVVAAMMSDYTYGIQVDYHKDMPSLKVNWLVGDFENKYYPLTSFDLEGLQGYWQTYMHPADVEFLHEQLQNALGGESSVCEVRILTQAAEYRWITNSVYPIIERGRVVRVYGAGRDIHTTKEAHLQLEIAKNDAESASRTKSAFLANMSHELRTPLTAIMGYTELLMEDLQVLDNARYIEDLKKVNFAAQHLYAVLGDLLDYARLETGDLYVTVNAFNINRLIESVIAVVPQHFQRNNNTLIKNVPPKLGHFYSDQNKVRQILFNLLTNATKFTENGTVTLTVEQTTLNDVPALRFIVEDTGIGIDIDKINTIFAPFQQADNSMTRRYGGTGLGLALNRSYVQMMHGVIMVKSEIGKGSTFTVILPSNENL